ncbi:hypothetical protein BJY00DRAFT_305133 [Aspergillus carlsbadensis]|nr:hypothetical protein BJY00DRAFT_305133 [Aspergillus carlsbadensis]
MTPPIPISIAIIGSGPGGLGTAIALSSLPFVSVTLYEQAPEPREVGAGISIGRNAWNVLSLLGAAEGVSGGRLGVSWQRNGRTGVVVPVKERKEKEEDPRFASIRARRTRLQAALLAQVPAGVIQFGKKLVEIRDLGQGQGVALRFLDGTETRADFVVGADGIRSIVRRALFPEHHLHVTGNTAFRVLIPLTSIAHIKDFPAVNGWWHGLNGHIYFAPVDDESDIQDNDDDEPRLFEITVRSYNETVSPDRTATWAIPVSNEKVRARTAEYDPRIQSVLDTVPEGSWREFAMVAGPCLREITAWDKVALIGDASHPLSGAFGSGAAFAMEDGWILARALEYEYTAAVMRNALAIFQRIRGPYYERMYDFLASREKHSLGTRKESDADFESIIKARVAGLGFVAGGKMDWIYKNDIERVWKEYVAAVGEQAARL